MFRLPPGFSVGHWTDARAVTGCTVILCPSHCVGGCDVRGSSPGSRELALLGSEKTMPEVHAVLLTGGSAYGLAAADGVMKFLAEHDVGYVTPWAKVPIVPAAVLFDLNIGSALVRPTADSGYAACLDAAPDRLEQGTIGGGTGATVGKWAGPELRMKGGLGHAALVQGDLIVSSLAIVNAVGDVCDDSGKLLAGARSAEGRWASESSPLREFVLTKPLLHANTTLAVIMTNARLSKVETNRVAQRGHNGLARAVRPVHSSFDGDVVFGLAAGNITASVDLVAEMGVETTAEAIRNGVKYATSLGGVIAHRDILPGPSQSGNRV